MAVRAAGYDDFGDIRFLQQVSRIFFELHEQRAGHPDGIDFDVTGTGPAGIKDQAPLEGAKGDGHIGKERPVFIVIAIADSARIGVDASRHIDGNDRDGTGGGSSIDFGNDGSKGLTQLPWKPVPNMASMTTDEARSRFCRSCQSASDCGADKSRHVSSSASCCKVCKC